MQLNLVTREQATVSGTIKTCLKFNLALLAPRDEAQTAADPHRNGGEPGAFKSRARYPVSCFSFKNNILAVVQASCTRHNDYTPVTGA
jgi:hypothetical protein